MSGELIFRTVCAADVQPEAVYWQWKPRIPFGRLTLLVGNPGEGKSTLYCALAAAVTHGAQLPGDDAAVDPSAVLILSAEDGIADTIRPRLQVAGADLSLVHVFDVLENGEETEHLTLRRSDHLAALERRIDEIGPALVVVDPLSAYLGETDSFQDSKVRAVLAPLAALASKYGPAVLAVMHLKKAADTALAKISGSVAFGAAARSVLLAGSDPDAPDTRALVHIKSNLAAPGPPLGYRLVPRRIGDEIETVAVEWTGVSDLTADRLLARAVEEGADALGEAVDFLKAELKGGEVEAKQVYRDAEAQGIAMRTLKRAKQQLGVKSRREGYGPEGTWHWRLDKEGQARRHPLGSAELAHCDQAVDGEQVAHNSPPIGGQRPNMALFGDSEGLTDTPDGPLWSKGGRDTVADDEDWREPIEGESWRLS